MMSANHKPEEAALRERDIAPLPLDGDIVTVTMTGTIATIRILTQ